MKKTLIVIGSIIGIVVLALAVVPFLFKDKIKAAIDKEIATTVNAQVLFEVDNFGLSVFRNFPNLTISIDEFGLIGKQPEFAGDTLFTAKSMRFVADIISVIKGEKIKIKSIYLYQPYIATYMAKNGANSWSTLMISTPADSLQKTPEEPSAFAVEFQKWEIEDGTIIYDDASLPMYARLYHVNHTGKGNLTEEIVDVQTLTSTPDFYVSYDNITYLNKHAFNAKMDINMNYVKGEYKFLENEFAINDFKFGLEGSIIMPGDDIRMDIKFKALETKFKNVLSLIPSIFMKEFDNIKTEGNLAFDGYVRGTMNDVSMPGYGLNLKISNGMMQYPDLPTAITNVKADVSVDNKDGITQNMIINVKEFHMNMGKNPVDIKALIEGIEPYKIDATVLAKINLEDITKIYPIEGTTLKGLFDLNLKANGIYSDTLKLMPIVDAHIGLQNGYVKTKDFPAPLEQVNFDITATSAGKKSNSKVWVNNFNMLLEKEPFNVKAYVENFDDMLYDVKMKGILDLTKLTKLYPIDGTTLSGRIKTNIETKGVMSDIEAGRYGNTSTSGTMEVSNLNYVSKDLPQGMKLTTASYSLTPEKMTINSMEGFLGKSDISIKGYFANYMGYLFGKKDTTLRGTMSFASKTFDVNEWMSEDGATAKQDTAAATGIFEVPKDVDFSLTTSIKKVLYTNMTLDDLSGNIIMKDGIAKMDKLKFNILGGGFLFTGNYNTQNIAKPTFAISEMKIDKMQIPDAYKTFNTIKTIAPVAENMKGTFSLTTNMNGDIGKDMMPVYATLNGAGTLQIQSAELAGNKVMQGIGNLTKYQLDPLAMKDVAIKFKIIDGKVKTEPFDINAGGMKMNLGGTNALDGAIDYLVKMDVPAGVVGSSVNNAVASLTGKEATGSQNIKLDFKVLGDYKNPKISLAGSSAAQSAKTAIKDAVVNKAKEAINNNEDVQKAKAEAERLRKESEAKAQAEADRLKKEAEEKAKSEANKLKEAAKKKFGF